MDSYESYLSRWHTAGLLDGDAVTRIRQFEQQTHTPDRHRWQTVIAFTLGAVLLGAGILLFVAAHWQDVSPASRFLLVIGMLALLHAGGILAQARVPVLATTLHAVGTVALGAAIAVVGQIFNMQSHWPAAVLLWALGSLAGWWLLQDNIQQAFAMLLLPAWLVCEFTDRVSPYGGGYVYVARIVMVLAAVYLTAFAHEKRGALRGWTFAAGALALPVTTVILSDGWNQGWRPPQWGFVPLRWQVVAFLLVLAGLAVAWFTQRSSTPVAAGGAVLAYALPWMLRQTTHRSDFGQAYTSWEPWVFTYLLLAAACVGLAAWAVRERLRAVVNYALLAFAAVVCWFYFSSVFDKLNRSLGLIGMGVLFLLGGLFLEKVRRRLLQQMAEMEAA